MNDKTIIKVNNLTHRFGNGFLGLDGISLEIANGDFVVIAGQNGCGKTTLLKYFNALNIAHKGVVEVDGKDARHDIRRTRSTVGLVFQDPDSQIVSDTVREDVGFGPGNLNWPRRKILMAVDEALEWVGLTHLADQSPHLLSGGERRRLAIAGILAMRPKVVLLDEPFANLDYPGVCQTLQCLIKLHAAGHTIVVSAHDLEPVIAHAQRLVVMNQGHVVADGKPGDIIHLVEKYGIRLPCAVRMGRTLESWLS
jgi:biotin transport system ATP-binding protein